MANDKNLYAHPPKASPMQELQAMGQEFDAKAEVSAALTGEMLKAALLEEGGDAYMRNEDTPSHFLIDGIVDLDAVAKAIASQADQGGCIIGGVCGANDIMDQIQRALDSHGVPRKSDDGATSFGVYERIAILATHPHPSQKGEGDE